MHKYTGTIDVLNANSLVEYKSDMTSGCRLANSTVYVPWLQKKG